MPIQFAAGLAGRLGARIAGSAVGAVQGAARSVASAANPVNILRMSGPLGNTLVSGIEGLYSNVQEAVRETKEARREAKEKSEQQDKKQEETQEEVKSLREQFREQQQENRKLLGGDESSTGFLGEILKAIDFSNELLFEMVTVQNEAKETQREQVFAGIEKEREAKRERIKEGTKRGEKEEAPKEKKSFFSNIFDRLKNFLIGGALIAAIIVLRKSKISS